MLLLPISFNFSFIFSHATITPKDNYNNSNNNNKKRRSYHVSPFIKNTCSIVLYSILSVRSLPSKIKKGIKRKEPPTRTFTV